ncbi:MAG: cation diffusion facilitator family transporter [Propionibacteriaceae bacterium]
MGAGHSHDHAGAGHSKVLAVVFTITFVTFGTQVLGAALTGSLALLVDAGHMLTDVLALAMALTAAQLMRRAATRHRTWGFRRAEVLSAAAQAVILGAVAVYAFVEGIQRLADPPEVTSQLMIVFGVVGLLGNVVAIGLLARNRKDNLNLRAAFLEVVNDALGSVAVITAAIVIATTGWLRADAVASMVVAVLMIPRALIVLRAASRVLLESTPRGLDLDEVRTHILGLPHVHSVHDLHASEIATGLPVLTAHVVVDDDCFTEGHLPETLDRLQQCVAEHFPVSVEHSTFQFEPVHHRDHEPAAHH